MSEVRRKQIGLLKSIPGIKEVIADNTFEAPFVAADGTRMDLVIRCPPSFPSEPPSMFVKPPHRVQHTFVHPSTQEIVSPELKSWGPNKTLAEMVRRLLADLGRATNITSMLPITQAGPYPAPYPAYPAPGAYYAPVTGGPPLPPSGPAGTYAYSPYPSMPYAAPYAAALPPAAAYSLPGAPHAPYAGSTGPLPAGPYPGYPPPQPYSPALVGPAPPMSAAPYYPSAPASVPARVPLAPTASAPAVPSVPVQSAPLTVAATTATSTSAAAATVSAPTLAPPGAPGRHGSAGRQPRPALIPGRPAPPPPPAAPLAGLNSKSAEELQSLHDDPDALEDFLLTQKPYTDLLAKEAELRKNNQALAQKNLARRAELAAKEAELQELIVQVDQLRKQVDAESARHHRASEQVSPRALSEMLVNAERTADAKSEDLAAQLTSGTLRADEFCKQYLLERKIYHQRAAKLAILRTQGLVQ